MEIMICSDEVLQTEPDESLYSSDKDSSTEPKNDADETSDRVQQLLDENVETGPLIPKDVASALLKIQSKYLDHHPCLCTSRFRHTLHLLSDDSHGKLYKLCSQLQLLTLEGCLESFGENNAMKLYKHFLPMVFDLDALLPSPNNSQDKYGSDDSSDGCCRADPCDAVIARLETILSRFVSDFNGIFAIEGELLTSKSDDDSSHIDHEHRKRHEEEDSCPEEIKQMKVACQELTLECNINNLEFSSNQKISNEFDQESKDHHVHRYYSLLRGEQGTKSDSSTRDPNHPPREGFPQIYFHLHGHQNSDDSFQQLQTSSLSVMPDSTMKQSHPRVLDTSAVYHFQAAAALQSNSPEDLKRKRRDTKSPRSSQINAKVISRSTSEILNESFGVDLPKRSFSENRLNIVLSSKPNMIIDDENSNATEDQGNVLKDEFLSSNPLFNNDDRRFDRDLGQIPKTRRSQTRSTRKKKSSRSRSSHQKNQEQDFGTSSPFSLATPETLSMVSVKDHKSLTSVGFEMDESFESTFFPTPQTSANCGNNEFSLDEICFEYTVKKDSGSLQDDGPPVRFEPSNMAYKGLRWSSWESTEPVVQDHFQQPDNQLPVVSWIPQLSTMRETELQHSNSPENFSTRDMGMLNSQKYLDPTHIQRLNSDKDSSKKGKVRQLSKSLKRIKQNMKELEGEFETKFRYKPSQAEKLKNEQFCRLMAEHNKLRKQIQGLKELDCGNIEETNMLGCSNDSYSTFGQTNNVRCSTENPFTYPGDVFMNNGGSRKITHSIETMTKMFKILQKQMDGQRDQSGRPFLFREMTAEQLLDEKNDLRSVLYQMEETFGYPTTNDEKNVTRDVYERYRTVKRLIRKNSATFRAKESIGELETIPEDLEVPLTLASPQHRIFIEVSTTTTDQRASEACPNSNSWGLFGSKTNDPSFRDVDENLHSLGRYELLEVQKRTREEKKHYRRIVKEKEDRFLRENALRRVTRDERQKIDEINYNLYKKSKAKLKLIEALLSKYKE